MIRLAGKLPTNAAGYCEEKKTLQDEFVRAAHCINELISRQTQALIDNDPDFARFDALLHRAQERKEIAKYAWITHVDSHGCHEHWDLLDLRNRAA